jgi:hypothetical protein
MAQRGVQQVRRTVVRTDPVASLAVDLLVDRLAEAQLSRKDLGPKHVQFAEWFRRILDFAGEAFESSESSTIADLTAAFSVEGSLVEEEFDGLADFGPLGALTVTDDRQDDAFAFVTRITRELGYPMFLDKVEPDVLTGFCS